MEKKMSVALNIFEFLVHPPHIFFFAEPPHIFGGHENIKCVLMSDVFPVCPPCPEDFKWNNS